MLGFFVVVLRKTKNYIVEDVPFRTCGGGGTSLVRPVADSVPAAGAPGSVPIRELDPTCGNKD